MKYVDGTEIRPGDVVQIGQQEPGEIVASMDSDAYLPGFENRAYLGQGVTVDTNFAGIVHYTADATDELRRLDQPAP